MKENNEKIQENGMISLEIEELEPITAPSSNVLAQGCAAGVHYASVILY